MKRVKANWWNLVLAGWVAACGGLDAAPAPRAFPTPEMAARLKALVEQEPSAQARFQDLRAAAEAALARKPQPLDVIHYEGLLDTDPRRVATVAALQDMAAADVLLDAWVVTGDARYRDALRALVLAWAGTYQPTGNPINENKLVPLLMAAGVLRATFAEPDWTRIQAWTRQLAEKGIEHGKRVSQSTRANWHPKRLKIAAIAGELCGEPAFTGYARSEAVAYIASSLRPDGGSLDFEHRDSLAYHCAGIKPYLSLAALLPPGEDFYRLESSGGASIRKSVDFIQPYARGEKTHEEFRNSQVELDRRRQEAGIEKYRKGRLFDPAQALALLEMAQAFDPVHGDLIARLAGRPGERFPTWQSVRCAVGWVREVFNE